MPLYFCFSVASFQVGKVLANSKYADKNYWQLSGGSGESDPGAGHHRVHFRCGWDAAIWEKLQRMCLQDL